jgi:hypothetical protein
MGEGNHFAIEAEDHRGLLGKGWIEQRGAGNDLSYRITNKGLAAKMTPVRIYK